MDTYLQTETGEVTQNASVRSSSLLSLRRSTGVFAATETAVDADCQSLLEDQNSSSIFDRLSSGSYQRPSSKRGSSAASPEVLAGTTRRNSRAFQSVSAAALAAQLQHESRTSVQTTVNYHMLADEPSVWIPVPSA